MRSFVVCFALADSCTLPGAGGAAGDASCKFAQTFTCQDDLAQSSLTLQTWKTNCASLNGVYSTGLCDRTGSLGGCRLDEAALMAGASIVTWYFPGAVADGKTLTTAADAMAQCPADGGLMYLSP
jgi:hypothetical protein